jgi:hypothetical protein
MLRQRHLILTLLTALATLLGCGGDEPGQGGPGTLRILSPRAGDTLSGVAGIELSLEPSVPLSGMSLRFDDEEWVPLHRPEGYLSVPTFDSANGDHRISVAVDSEAGEHLEAEVDVSIDNPSHRLLSLDGQQTPVSNGQMLSLELEYSLPGLSLAADLSALDSRFSPGAARFEELGAGRYRLTYLVSRDNLAADGGHRVAIASTDADGRTNLDYLPLELRKLPRLPFTVREGTFIDAPRPELGDTTAKAAGPGAPAPSITSLQGASVLPVGAELPLEITVAQASGNPVERLLVSAQGFSGFFVVPAQAGSSQITLGLPALAAGQPDVPLSLSVAAVGANGSSSGWVSRSIQPLPLPLSGVMVTLFWDSAADMDLTMHTMGGAIDFGTRSADGGTLNLDANSQCEGSIVSTENISWAPAEVRQGPYEVYVNEHDACGAASTNWTVIAQFCGRVEVRSGTVNGSNVMPGADGPLVLPFNVDCTQRITGRIEYQTISGSTNFFTPAPFVPVRAVPASGTGAALATTFSDAAGNYALVFPNPQQRPVAIEVETSWVDPYTGELRIEVTPERSDTVHELRAPETVAASEANRVLNWRVDAAHGAGALSTLNTLRRGYSWALAHLPSGRALGGLRARWDAKPSADFFTNYRSDTHEVWISSKPEALDDFDASVIAHEFMHFVIGTLSFDSPGGGHMFKSNPQLALAEGAATAFGQAALGSSEYINLGRFWSLEDLETPLAQRAAFPPGLKLPATFGTPEPVAQERFGTSDGTLNGLVSEWLVAMIFWDMMDGAGGAAEPHDLFADRTLGLSYSLLSHLAANPPPDRGAPGRDLVDALDGFQQYYGASVKTGVERLTQERGFPYVSP